jgi:hypothetical protein
MERDDVIREVAGIEAAKRGVPVAGGVRDEGLDM